MKEWKRLIESQGIATEGFSSQSNPKRGGVRKVTEAKKKAEVILPNTKNVKNSKQGVNSKKVNKLQEKTNKNAVKNVSIAIKKEVCSTGRTNTPPDKPQHTGRESPVNAQLQSENVLSSPEKKMNESLIQPFFNNHILQTNKPLPNLPYNEVAMPQKALPPEPDEYSYASVEYRPMTVSNNTLMSSTIDDKTKPSKTPQGDYSYTSVNPRPMAVGMNSAVSIPVPVEKPNEPEELVVDNLHLSVNGDLYALVDKPPKYPGPKPLEPVKSGKPPTQQRKTSIPGAFSLYDSVADPPASELPANIADLYATVDLSQKRRVSTDATGKNMGPLLNKEFYPPGFNRGSRRVSDGMLNTPFFMGTAGGRKPPPMPRPYQPDRKAQLAPHIEERLNSRVTRSTSDVAATCTGYSEVTFDQTKRHPKPLLHSQSIENFDRHHSPDSRLSKSQNTEQLSAIRQVRTHRRLRSHENVAIFRSMDYVRDTSSGNSSALSDKSSRLSNSSSSISKDSEDESFPPRINETTTPDYFSKITPDHLTDDLPEGWQEVKDGTEPYYWHLWTGTIQYERPSNITPPSSSRSISPFSGLDSANSSRATSLSDGTDDRSLKPRPETPEVKSKQVISFPVHSMGWMEVDENLMLPKIIGETVNNCITTLANLRHDLYNTSETWADGADLKLVLEGETLKLVHPETKHVYHNQPIAKMRVWGVGREGEEKRDFAYIARDPATQKHKCHMFRCHGHVSGRSVTNALQAICTRVLGEIRKAKGRESPLVKPMSDLMRPPSKVSGANFNEKTYPDQKKCFTAKYVGSSNVTKPSGVDILNKAVQRVSDGEVTSSWPSVLLEVTTSEIKTIDCVKQQTLMEHRVRFVTFLGVAHDERYGAYIVAESKDNFMCHVFFCAPHAGTLTKAIEEACKLRFEKMLDSQNIRQEGVPNTEQPNLQMVPSQQNQTQQQHQQIPQQQQQQIPLVVQQRGGVKEKTTKLLTNSIAGVFSKFNKKEIRKKEDESPSNSRPTSYTLKANEHVVKYFGSVVVSIGTGREPVESSVNQLSHGEAMLGYLELEHDCITLSDAQRSAISRRVFDVNNISYCGMNSDRQFFGIIVARGKGKYLCHVFQENEANTGIDIVDAIQNIL